LLYSVPQLRKTSGRGIAADSPVGLAYFNAKYHYFLSLKTQAHHFSNRLRQPHAPKPNAIAVKS
jgi:hypothetical protein